MRVLMTAKWPFIGPEPTCGISMGVVKKAVRDPTIRDHRKHWDSLSELKQAKAIMQDPSASKTGGAIKIKEKPAMMVDRTNHRTLSHKRAPFQTGINK
jgi:hypothetical protein